MIFISPYLKGGKDAAKLSHRTNYIAIHGSFAPAGATYFLHAEKVGKDAPGEGHSL